MIFITIILVEIHKTKHASDIGALENTPKHMFMSMSSEIHENPRKLVEIYEIWENIWKFMKINEKPWT